MLVLLTSLFGTEQPLGSSGDSDAISLDREMLKPKNMKKKHGCSHKIKGMSTPVNQEDYLPRADECGPKRRA